MYKNDLAVFYRARQSIRRGSDTAITEWTYDYKIVYRSEYDYTLSRLAASKEDAIRQCLTNKLDDELGDYEVEITNLQEVTW